MSTYKIHDIHIIAFFSLIYIFASFHVVGIFYKIGSYFNVVFNCAIEIYVELPAWKEYDEFGVTRSQHSQENYHFWFIV